MSFLAPLFLLGALAVAAPIVLHLIRRTTRDEMPFSSLMFLQPTPPRVTRRSRLENLWLLLLRSAAIALLALGFARPFVQREAAGRNPETGARTVILVDASASMRRENLWAQARAKADAAVLRASSAGDVALVVFDRTRRVLLGFEESKRLSPEQRAAAGERLGAITPGWSGTALGTALLDAAAMMETPEDAGRARREIVVISDLQDGSRLEGLQGFEWPRGLTVTLDPVRAAQTENAAAQWIAETDEPDAKSTVVTARLRVANAVESKREQFQIRRPDAPAAAPIEAYVPAGQSRVVRLPGAAVAGERLLLSGDETEFDNTLFVLAPPPARISVLFLGDDAEADPAQSLYYLPRAFQNTPRETFTITTRRGAEPVNAWDAEQAKLLVLGEGGTDATLESARQFSRAGKIVLLPMTAASDADRLARLLGTPPPGAEEARVKDYAMLAQIDFQHPLFAAFADPRFSDFTKIHVWKYRRFDAAKFPGARVLARFDSGDPAIMEAPLGAGSVVALATSWRPADSQLALSSKFVPLLRALLDLSRHEAPRRAQYFVGDEVPLPSGTQGLTVRKPDGMKLPAEAGGKFTGTDQPGIYVVTPGALRFAVNLAPEESRLTPLAPERFASLGVPLKPTAPSADFARPATDPALTQATELEGRQKLWRWLIAATFMILLAETIVAARHGRVAGTPALAP